MWRVGCEARLEDLVSSTGTAHEIVSLPLVGILVSTLPMMAMFILLFVGLVLFMAFVLFLFLFFFLLLLLFILMFLLTFMSSFN